MATKLLARRYANDGVPSIPLSPAQQTAWKEFWEAERIGTIRRLEVEVCPLCQSSLWHLLAAKDRYGDSVQTVICRDCGLIYSRNPLNADSAVRFYAHYYRNLYQSDPIRDFAAIFAEAERFTPRAKKLLNYLGLVPEKTTVVDYGCGGGWNLHPYRLAGCQVIGFDYGKDMIKLGKTRSIDIYDITETPPEKIIPQADLYILSEVLEHTLDPYSMLLYINGLLKKGGYLYLTVPSLIDLPFGYKGADLLNLLQNAHNFLFDKDTLDLLLNQAGFSLIFHRSANQVLAIKDKEPHRRFQTIPGGYKRNLSRLWLSEYVARPYWGLVNRVSTTVGGTRLQQLVLLGHKLLLSSSRRRDFRERRVMGV